MALRPVQVNITARDDAVVGGLWADVLGWGVSSEGPGVTNVEPPGFSWPDPVAVCIDVVSVPNPESVDYRVRLYLASRSAEHQAATVARLTGSGARYVDTGPAEAPWIDMADPEGNVFRVLEPRPLYDTTGPIAAVVVDCANPREMARFWSGATDWTLHAVSNDLARLRSAAGVGPYLEFVRVPGGAMVSTRMHLDVKPYEGDDQAAEVRRLTNLGASAVDIGHRARCRGWSSLTRKATSFVCCLPDDENPSDTRLRWATSPRRWHSVFSAQPPR